MSSSNSSIVGDVSMSRLATAVHMTLRGSGALLILLGLALWALSFLAARAGVQRGIVVAGFAWGLIAPILGLTQANLLTNDWHWVIQILHLLVGLAAIGTGEGLAQRMRRLGASQVKAA